MLLVILGPLAAVVAGTMIWQQVRWTFATPLATAFHQHERDSDEVSVRNAQVRKFIALGLLEADELAKAAGFDCKGLKNTKSLVVCYRDVWTGLCKSIWSLELTYDDKNKITRANGRIRKICLF